MYSNGFLNPFSVFVPPLGGCRSFVTFGYRLPYYLRRLWGFTVISFFFPYVLGLISCVAHLMVSR